MRKLGLFSSEEICGWLKEIRLLIGYLSTRNHYVCVFK